MKRRLLIILMVIAILMLSVPEAFAAGSVRYIKSPNGRKVNLRFGPSEKGYGVACQVGAGTEVKYYSSKGGWATIEYNGVTLYVMTKYLSATKSSTTGGGSGGGTATAKGKTRYIKSPNGKKVNLRFGPSEKGYTVAAQVEAGTEVKLFSSKGGWSTIEYNGVTLYVMSKYLSSTKSGSSGGSGGGSSTATKVRYIKSPNGKKVNVRTGPSEKGYAVASQLEPGTEVALISSSKGWAKIRVNGFVVYVKTRYLTTKAP